MRLSLKAINAELARRGFQAMLGRGDGYFYFWGGEAVDWLDRTVRVPTLQSLTLEQWIDQFNVLLGRNHDLLTGTSGFVAGKPKDGDRQHLDLNAAKRSAKSVSARQPVQSKADKKKRPQ